MSDKEIENNAFNEEASETVETPESEDSTPETAETVADAEEASAPEESVPEAPAETAEADVSCTRSVRHVAIEIWFLSSFFGTVRRWVWGKS